MTSDDCVGIYSLNDPRTNKARYVGKAAHLKNRYALHISDPASRVREWIQDLAGFGCRPVMVLLDIVPRDVWPEMEKNWFERLKDDDMLLNNEVLVGIGGEHPKDVQFTHDDVLGSMGDELFIRDGRDMADPSEVRADIIGKLGLMRSLRSFKDREVATAIKTAWHKLDRRDRSAVIRFLNDVIAVGR